VSDPECPTLLCTPQRECWVGPKEWAAAFRDRCATAGIRFFMKQMARKAPIPGSLLVRQFPAGA